MKSLDGTAEAWLSDVLFAFNAGDLEKFRANEQYWSTWPDMVKNRAFLEGKIRLLCLMEVSLKILYIILPLRLHSLALRRSVRSVSMRFRRKPSFPSMKSNFWS